jgi:hypothetical protein
MAVFDSDQFGAASHPEWRSWANGWLLVAAGLAANGLDTALCGFGLQPAGLDDLEARPLVGRVHALYLDLDADELARRLRLRPTSARYDEARIARKLAEGDALRAQADDVLDINGCTIAETADAVEAWLRAQQRRQPRSLDGGPA